LSDGNAVQMLRTASMHSKQRLGQVSRHIIHSARFAEDANRSGQLRMLSQRLAGQLLQLAGVQPAQVEKALQESVRRIDATAVALGKACPSPRLATCWPPCRATRPPWPRSGSPLNRACSI
jgi:hypothetical protein